MVENMESTNTQKEPKEHYAKYSKKQSVMNY